MSDPTLLDFPSLGIENGYIGDVNVLGALAALFFVPALFICVYKVVNRS